MICSSDLRRMGRSRAVTAISMCTIAVLATLAVSGGAQAVTPPTVLLGTAGQFALLAGSGMTNTGVSTVSGDVGSSPLPTETGFAPCPAADCVNLTGANHTAASPNDATTQAAKVALTTAYDDAAGRSSTTVGTELAGQTLVAGAYSSLSGTFGMTGTLILDGENNADAVFIFQTASTLITAASGNISLIRGAQACNIFWKVGSAATLGAGSTLRGTILAHDTITLGDAVTVDGRLLAGEQASGTGAITMIHDTIIKPSTCVTQAELDAAATTATTTTAATTTTTAATTTTTTATTTTATTSTTAAITTTTAATTTSSTTTSGAPRGQTTSGQTTTGQTTNGQTTTPQTAAAQAAAAAKATTAKGVTAKKVAAAKKEAATSKQHGHARPPRRHVGLTG
jgi:hypothetical protein